MLWLLTATGAGGCEPDVVWFPQHPHSQVSRAPHLHPLRHILLCLILLFLILLCLILLCLILLFLILLCLILLFLILLCLILLCLILLFLILLCLIPLFLILLCLILLYRYSEGGAVQPCYQMTITILGESGLQDLYRGTCMLCCCCRCCSPAGSSAN